MLLFAYQIIGKSLKGLKFQLIQIAIKKEYIFKVKSIEIKLKVKVKSNFVLYKKLEN